MQTIREALSDVWTALNPSEPTPMYLVKFLGFAVTIFALALVIGQYTI